MGQGGSGAQLQVRRLRMEELFRDTSFGTRRKTQGASCLVTQDHGRILKEMLGNEILTLGKTTGALQGTEGHEGLEKALTNTARSVPRPKIRRQGPAALRPGDRRQSTMGEFKGGNLGGQTETY